MGETRLITGCLFIVLAVAVAGEHNFRYYNWISGLPQGYIYNIRTRNKDFVLRNDQGNYLINNIRITPQQYNDAFFGNSVSLTSGRGKPAILQGNGQPEGLTLNGEYLFPTGVEIWQVIEMTRTIRVNSRVRSVNFLAKDWMRYNHDLSFIWTGLGGKLTFTGVRGGQSILLNGVPVTQQEWNDAINGEKVEIIHKGRSHQLSSTGQLVGLRFDDQYIVDGTNLEVALPPSTFIVMNGQRIDFKESNWITMIPDNARFIVRTSDGRINVLARNRDQVLINNTPIRMQDWARAFNGETLQVSTPTGYVTLSGDETLEGFLMNGKPVFGSSDRVFNYATFGNIQFYINGRLHRFNVATEGWMSYLKNFHEVYYQTATRGNVYLSPTPDPAAMYVNSVLIKETDWLKALNGDPAFFSHNNRQYELRSQGYVESMELNGQLLFGDNIRLMYSTRTFSRDQSKVDYEGSKDGSSLESYFY